MKYFFLWLCCILCELAFANGEMLCIPHHAGEKDWPSNSLYALNKAQLAGFKTVNLTLELSKDGVPFAYHGFNLLNQTNVPGNPESATIPELKALDAAYNFSKGTNFPLRGQGITISTLDEMLAYQQANNLRLILDLKSHDNVGLVKAVITSINKTKSANKLWANIVFYSTDSNSLALMKKLEPRVNLFLDRQTTFNLLLSGVIDQETSKKLREFNWIGFELYREVQICEQFTLGKNCVNITRKMWNRQLIHQLKAINPNLKVVVFAVNTPAMYQSARMLGADAVYVDSPLEICRLNRP